MFQSPILSGAQLFFLIVIVLISFVVAISYIDSRKEKETK